MADRGIGKVFVELDLDPSRYMRSQQTLLKESQHGATVLEKNFKNLGIKSGATFDLMRAQAEKSFEAIKKSGKATTDDLIRAEKAKNERIKSLNEQQYGHTTTMFEKIKKNWMAVSAAIIAGWYAINKVVNIFKDVVITMAARYETLGIVMRTVGNTAGYTNDQMLAFQAGLEKTGISAIEARQSLTRMNQAQLDLSKSSKLARVAQDAAVIGAMNSSEAFNQMVYGIQSANVRVLRTIGINVSFEESYKRVAAQLGRTTDSFNEIEKANIRMNAVLEAGKTIAGTYEAAMETAGKQLLSLQRHFDNLKVVIGDLFTPALAEVIEQITESIKGINNELKGEKADAIHDWGVKFRITLIDIEAEIMRLAMFIDKIGGTLTALWAASAATGAGWGIEKKGSLLAKIFGSEEEYQEALKRNLELENRYLATEKKLTDLAEKRRLLEESLTDKGKKRVAEAAEAAEKERLAAAARAKAEQEAQELADLTAKLRKESLKEELIALDKVMKEQDKYIKNPYKMIEKELKLQKSMYEDMKDYSQDYFDTVNQLIDIQAQKYRELGVEEKKIDEWVTKEKQKTIDARIKMVADEVKDMLGDWSSFFKYMGESNKQYFAIYKALAISETMISTYQAATEAYKAMAGIPVVGPALAVAAAAAAIAAGLANIAEIKAQNYQGYASGGWLANHPQGGLISEGSGVSDDVYLGSTGRTNHWAMRGEQVFILNKEAVRKYGQLLDIMNSKGYQTGGWLETYPEAPLTPQEIEMMRAEGIPLKIMEDYENMVIALEKTAQKTFSDIMKQIDDSLGLISPLAKALEDANKQFDDYITQLKEANVSTEKIAEVEARRVDVLNDLIRTEEKEIEKDLQSRLAELILSPDQLAIYENLQDFIESMDEIKELADVTGKSYENLIAQTKEVYALEMRSAIEQSEAAKDLQDAANQWTDIAKSIDDNIYSLQTSLANPENVMQRMQRVWDEITGLEAQGADTPDEIEKLQDLYNEYLDFAQEAYQRPSTQYQMIYDTVIDALTKLKDDAENFASSYEIQRDAYITAQLQLETQTSMKMSLDQIAEQIMAGIPIDLTIHDIEKTRFAQLTAQEGGIFSGPDSGYLVELHGIEEVRPINNYYTQKVGKDYPELSLTIHVHESKNAKATAKEVINEFESFMRSDTGREIIRRS